MSRFTCQFVRRLQYKVGEKIDVRMQKSQGLDRIRCCDLDMRLSIFWSNLMLALVIGCGYAYLGWHWNTPLSRRSHLVRMLLVFFWIGVFLAAVWLVDRGLLSLLSDSTHRVVYRVPGVYVESPPGFRRLSIASDVPPYWLVAMIYGILTAVAGNLIHRVHKRRSI